MVKRVDKWFYIKGANMYASVNVGEYNLELELFLSRGDISLALCIVYFTAFLLH